MSGSFFPPLPEEFSEAHAGRIAIFKRGFISKLERLALVQDLAEAAMPGIDLVSLDCRMAVLSGMKRSDYVRRHSMLPAFRVVDADPDYTPVPFGEEVPPLRILPPRLKLYGARTHFCRECIQLDLSSQPYSWFRRIHNLPGIEMCPTHARPLERVLGEDPWFRLPHQWLATGQTAPVEIDLKSRQEYRFQLRLGYWYQYLLGKSGPFQGGDLLLPLQVRLSEMNPGIRYFGLDETVFRNIPGAWIERNCLGGRSRWRLLRGVNLFSCRPSLLADGFLYAIVLAAMFDSSEHLQGMVNSFSSR